MKFKTALQKAGFVLKKHSPAIFTGVGILGLGATAYLAYKSKDKVEKVVIELEEKRDNGEEVNKVEVVRDVAEAIALPVAVGVASCICIFMSHRIQHKRIMTLAGALAMEQARGVYFEKKYKSQHGEEAYQEFIRPTEKVEKEVDGEAIVQEIKVDIDKSIGQWYDESEEYYSDDHLYNMQFIDSVNDKMQTVLFQRGYLLLNEVRENLGFERIKSGALLGWTTSDSFEIEKSVNNIKDEDGNMKEQIWVTWKRPRYIYNDMEFTGRYAL